MPQSGQLINPAFALWPQTHGANARLISHSENQIFEITSPSGALYSLRLHRAGYQSASAITSELAWLTALHADTSLSIPKPCPGLDGQLLQNFQTPQGETRYAVLFDHIPGIEPTPTADLERLFGRLGEYAATLHTHASRWHRPSDFQRTIWEAATVLPPDAPWGDWRKAPGALPHNRPVLDRLAQTLWKELAAYGTSLDRFGLIHADMRLGNLLVDGEKVSLIDFDDCGFGWFVFDFAAAISFHETSPAIPALKAAWLAAYQQLRKLEPLDIAMIDTMIMLRRMALLAWIGTHAETRLAQTHIHGFADDTAMLADRYLSGRLLR